MLQIPLLQRASRSGSQETKPVLVNGKRVFPLRLDLKFTDSDQVISVQLADCLLVGRESTPTPDVDLTFLNAVHYGISRLHAAFLYDGRSLTVEDLNSRNGTRINGYRIEGGKPSPLHNGDELEIGHLRLIVQLVRISG